MLRTSSLLTTLVLAALWVLSLGTGRAPADPIQPGFDLFATDSDQTFVVIPGLGQVPLMGVPFDTDRIGTTDTIVQRLNGIDPFPVGGSGTVQIQMVGLFLMSQNPVTFPDGTMADMYVTVNLNGDLPIPIYAQMPPSQGQMQVRHELEDGGTFQSFFEVFANIIFTQVGGDPFDPAQVMMVVVSPPVHFMGASDWGHAPTPNYPVDDRYPAGSFYLQRPFTEAEMLAAHGIHPATIGP